MPLARLQSALLVIGSCAALCGVSPLDGQYMKSCRALIKARPGSQLLVRRMSLPGEVLRTDELASLLTVVREPAPAGAEPRLRAQLQAAWRSDSAGLGLRLAAIIVDDARYPSDIAAAASHYYREFSGAADPLLDLAQDDGLAARVLLVIAALKTPLPAERESHMLRWACDAFAAVRGTCSDGWSAASWVNDGYPFWPRNALRVLEQTASVATGATRRQIREMRSALGQGCV